MPRAFVRNVLVAALLVLAAVAALNAAVDPFQQYRIPTGYAARFYPVFQRFEASGIARHYAYERAIIGSSMTENLVASEVDRRLGGKTFNLSLGAMTAYDARRLLEVALARGTVKQVLFNLVGNGFKFTERRSSPRVAFGCALQDGLPVYFVEDNGAGFDMSHSDKLFAPFQRLHSAAEYPGTGIGLAIVKKAVERMGGTVGVISSPGKGAEFWIKLVAAENSPVWDVAQAPAGVTVAP